MRLTEISENIARLFMSGWQALSMALHPGAVKFGMRY
jgi:hypothetical protein